MRECNNSSHLLYRQQLLCFYVFSIKHVLMHNVNYIYKKVKIDLIEM